MTHYSDDENMVRVDIFKPSGKWYTTFAIEWNLKHYLAEDIMLRPALLEAVKSHPDGNLASGWIIVCLEPYHEHAHPQMITVE